MEYYSPVLKKLTDVGIALNTRLYGIECKIYYPVSVGHYSGQHDDIEFRSDPDLIERLLIPQIYQIKRTPQGGINDMLYDENMSLYISREFVLPHLSKIVVISAASGTMQFLVTEMDSVTTIQDTLYKAVTIVPFLSYRNNDDEANIISDNLSQEFLDEIDDIDSTIDRSVAIGDPKDVAPDDRKFFFREIK